jgi:predicted nucleotidyltransferase
MNNESLLTEFTDRMRAAAGSNLMSIILYGSAADGEFHPEYSDLNLMCVVSDTSLASLAKIAPVADWWRSKKHHPPLVLTSPELQTSADVFSIEFLDMKQRYRVLYGEDVLRGLDVPMQLHRRQLEYELREKLFLLRQHVLLAGTDDKKLWEIMLSSLSSFTTLFRHALVEVGEQGRKHSRDAVVELSKRLNFSDSSFLQLLDVRAKKSNREQLSATDVAGRYLQAIEQVVAAVDTMQSPGAKADNGVSRREGI